MKFSDFVCFDATVTELNDKNRDQVIETLVSAIDNSGKLGKNNAKTITKAVIKRENEASTGMGKGIAVPHVKHRAVKNIVAALGQSSTGIDFSSLDKQPVYSVILLLSPVDKPDEHLQAMECIFKYLQKDKFRKFLRQAQKPEQIEDLLKEADENTYLYQ